jgi:hypothetical protein
MGQLVDQSFELVQVIHQCSYALLLNRYGESDLPLSTQRAEIVNA